MTQYLPNNLLALFAPRDPIPYLPPVDKLPYEKNTTGYSGISAYVCHFEDPGTTPAPVKFTTKEERQELNRKAKAEATAYKLEQDIALWSPTNNPRSTTDAYKTLFVARINYDTSEAKLRREFEMYGPIKKIIIVHNQEDKPRGYAFIEYERERDMHSAYKHADGKKIDSRRVLVDVERGRTVKGWLPRRLGGGLGGTRRGGPDVNVKHSGREETRNEERERYAGGGGGGGSSGGGGGGGKERPVERERERPERPERRRSRSRSRDRRRRSRERHRTDRHSKRDRSRDRTRGDRGATSDDEVKQEGNLLPPAEGTPGADASREKRRRSRERDHKRRRSRSRDRKSRRDHDRGDRDRDRERRREKDRGDMDKNVSHDTDEPPMLPVKTEDENMDPEPSQDGFDNSTYDGGEYNNNNNNYDNNGETNEGYDEGY